ncbi:5'-methylthioadenosine/S-adenosylhomocysteine nucleosidase [Desulforhopalus sp. 52FAK]
MKNSISILTLLSFLMISVIASVDQAAGGAVQTERVAIISAFGPEIEKLKSQAIIEEERVINGRSFTLCEIEGKKVVLFLSGISMVNAAMTTQMALDNFNITHILFSGIAGGVNPKLNIGDVTIPARWAQYQEAIFARKTEKGFDLGWHKQIYPGFGMMFPQNVDVTHGRLEGVNGTEHKFWFEVDNDLLAVARNISGVQLQDTFDGARLSHAPKLVVGGRGVSGMTFVDNAAYREWVFATFEADCLDMESAAVAHVAYVSDIPYIIFRSLSDLAGGGERENEMETFFKLAANNAAEVLLQFLKAWK